MEDWINDNDTRSKRQLEGVYKWRDSRGRGSLIYPTGFGKTRCALLIVEKLLEHRTYLDIKVVVPTIALKNQWEAILTTKNEGVFNQKLRFDVHVVNTIVVAKKVKLDDLSCDLAIFDEVHLYLHGKVFSTIFEALDFKWSLGLSGTISDKDRRILDQHCPVVDYIELEYAREQGWVSDYIEYNLLIDLYEEDQEQYDLIEEHYSDAFAWFHDGIKNNYDAVRGCRLPYTRLDPKTNVRLVGANDYVANNKEQFSDMASHEEAVKFIMAQANIVDTMIQKRKELLSNNAAKIDTTVDIINRLKLKTVTFGESTEMADKLSERLGDISMTYHSNITSRLVKIPVTLKDGTPVLDQKGNPIYKEEKYGAKRLKQLALERLIDNVISVVNSAKALDLGLDVADMACGIITQGYGGNTGIARQNQRKGRVIRKEKDKLSIIVNTIARNTQDEKWASQRQQGSRKIITVESVDQLIEHFKNKIKQR